ncbi:MAG: hypothetical protein IPP56_05630 [Bacteroidetes bacterium]|nr:hypothetical protein [Bacteroidota bacterium]MBK9799224.1 hypothetical protein [Bacteroidota bacterium]MBP6413711.1 hypothetical protein [Bacteroidia bacterium]
MKTVSSTKGKIIAVFAALLLVVGCASEDDSEVTPIDERDKYIGTWSCAENSSNSGSSTFDVVIRKNSNSTNQLYIDNFYLLGSSHSALVDKSGTSLNIATQSISGNTVQGSGTINSDTKINLTYTVNDGSGGSSAINSCTAVLSKK